jgi:single-strand DNA-binding protein
MKDINVVSLTGRLTRDMEIKYTPSGTPVGKFALAVNRNKKRGDKWVDEASFFECAYFGKSAEGLSQYMTKGKQLGLSGEMRQERWTAQDGQNQSRVVVVVSSLSLMGSKEAVNKPQQAPAPVKAPQQNQYPGPEVFDDDIPF